MADLINKEVTHKIFGKGKITKIDEDKIFIKFETQENEKQFKYPGCFDKFISLVHSQDKKLLKAQIELKDKQLKKNNAKKESVSILTHSGQHQLQKKIRSTPKTLNLQIPKIKSIDDFKDNYIRALNAEIRYLKDNGAKRNHLSNGKLISRKDGKYFYSFESDSELTYPSESDISIWMANEEYKGKIVSCEEYVVVIVTKYNLGEQLISVDISAEMWRLLNLLIKRLNEIQDYNISNITKGLILEGPDNNVSNADILVGQNQAINMAKSQPITFIWGPPGTGKTETLADIALEHITLGHTILMLSYSNVSVDGAITRVFKKDTDKKPGKLVRYGYARDKELLEHKYLTAYNLVIHKNPALYNKRTKLIDERKKLSRDDKKYVEISEALNSIHDQLKEAEIQAVHESSFLATTVSKAIADKTIYEEKFDVVIFDEASMAYIPQLIFAASLATKYFVCLGDFAQLPPIVQNSKRSLLELDIFRYCGIYDAVQKGYGHNWLCMLNTQYRMHPNIADFASSAMYHSLLKSNKNMEKNRKHIVDGMPIQGKAVALGDLSGMMTVCSQQSDYSRINPLSALIAIGLAAEGAKEHEIGIITPYSAQSHLFNAMAQDIAKINPSYKSIICATVHQFQGSEKDIVIYDAVDCYRQTHPGILITNTANDYASRLFNVALTRAKGKFIALTNVDYMEKKNLSSQLMFKQLINRYKSTEDCLKAPEINNELRKSQINGYQWFDQNEGNSQFIKDIKSAKKYINIDYPGHMNCDLQYAKNVAKALNSAKGRGVKISIRVEDKSWILPPLREFTIEHKFVMQAISIIDRKITWFGQPLSSDEFISNRKVIPTKYRPTIRFIGTKTADSLYKSLEMDKKIDEVKDIDNLEESNDNFARYVATHCTCATCGSPMILKKSKKANGKKGFFLACSDYPKCKKTENITVDLVEDYFKTKGDVGLRCPQCHCSLEARLGYNGVYTSCLGLAEHKYNLDEI